MEQAGREGVATEQDVRENMVQVFARLAEGNSDEFWKQVRKAPRDAMNEIWIDSPRWLRKRIERVLGRRRTK